MVLGCTYGETERNEELVLASHDYARMVSKKASKSASNVV